MPCDNTYININKCTEEKPHQCKICVKTFSGDNNLECHLWTHSGEEKKTYQFSPCDSFFYKIECFQNIWKYTVEKPYQYSHYDNHFLHMDNFDWYIRNQTGEKPYKCSHCDKAFLIGLPTKHIRTHTVVLNKLMTMRTHTEEKPH